MTAVAFWGLAVLAVVSGFGVFRVNSMARATFLLAVSFIAVGAEFLLISLQYIGVVTILMMVMEMAIMAIFMIMFMMNPAGLMPMSMFHNKKGSMSAAVVTFLLLGSGAVLIPWPQRTPAPPTSPTHDLGAALMGSKMLVMMTISPLLFATMVAAIALGSARGRYARYGKNLGAKVPADPIRGGIGR